MTDVAWPAPGAHPRAAAITLIDCNIRGDTAGVGTVIERASQTPWCGDLIHAALALYRALALRLHTPAGMLALYTAIVATAHDDPNPDRRLGAQLLLGHAQAADPAEDDEALHNIGVEAFNEVIDTATADGRFDEVFTEALALWRRLLPEVNTATVPEMLRSVAVELWPDPTDGQ